MAARLCPHCIYTLNLSSASNWWMYTTLVFTFNLKLSAGSKHIANFPCVFQILFYTTWRCSGPHDAIYSFIKALGLWHLYELFPLSSPAYPCGGSCGSLLKSRLLNRPIPEDHPLNFNMLLWYGFLLLFFHTIFSIVVITMDIFTFYYVNCSRSVPTYHPQCKLYNNIDFFFSFFYWLNSST